MTLGWSRDHAEWDESPHTMRANSECPAEMSRGGSLLSLPFQGTGSQGLPRTPHERNVEVGHCHLG